MTRPNKLVFPNAKKTEEIINFHREHVPRKIKDERRAF